MILMGIAVYSIFAVLGAVLYFNDKDVLSAAAHDAPHDDTPAE